MTLPDTETLRLQPAGFALHVTLNRPQVKNAMSLQMVQELLAVLDAAAQDSRIRAIVLRGAQGHFCAGGDIKDMAGARAAAAKGDEHDPFYALNRTFGELLTRCQEAPQVVVAVLEGAVMGGGFGLACVADVALTLPTARFGLPETGLGLVPAQIAPFVVQRIGLTQARRLALLGLRFDGAEAVRLGLAHTLCADTEALDRTLQETLTQIRHCAPHANRQTKALLLQVGQVPLQTLLDAAAATFSQAIRSAEGQEGAMAFIQKRPPLWAQDH